MVASISSSIVACLMSFNEFIENIRQHQRGNVGGLVAGAWEDELGRLRMWAANIGAHQTGQSSLDFRLRDASHIREQIVKLLQGLLRRLQDARDVLAEDEESDDEEAADELMDEEDPKTEIQELQESVATTINCLFQMSMLVRKPAQHDVHLGAKRADVAAFEPFDYNHVREKYPRADGALVKRLGSAITRRRKYLKYRERHATKLKQGIDKVDARGRDFQEVHEGETIKEGTTSILSDTVATDFQHQNIDFDDNTSDTGTQTSYAPTLLGGGNVTIPPPPKSSLGGVLFECPYCFYLISVHGTRSWNKHVFQDLQPYICIALTCATPEKLYPTRHEWVHHSNMAHPAAMTDDGAPEESKGFAACPLCKEEIDLGKQYDRHVARHLQELALFILPGSEEDSDMSDDQEAESRSSADSIHLAASHDRSKSPDDLPSYSVEYHAADENLHLNQGQDEEEEKLRLQLEERSTVLGPEHPETLRTMATLASIYLRQRRLTSAEELFHRALTGSEKTLGSDHPHTLNSVDSLGILYHKQGKLVEAEAMYQRALTGREKTLGSDHPHTLNSVDSLGILYHKQGKLVEAEAMYQRALTEREKTLGSDHPSTLNTVHRLGDLYNQQGKLAEAEVMYQRVLKTREKIWS